MTEINKSNKFLKTYKKYIIMIISCLIINFILISILPTVELEHPNATITNIGDAIWYTIVTTASVGYGDKFPLTLYGKFVGTFFILQGMAILTIVIGHVSSFLTIIKERKRMGFYGTNFANHIIIIGWNNFANLITKELVDAGKLVAIVTDLKDEVEMIHQLYPEDKVFVLFTSINQHSSYLKANISNSKLIFVNLKTDTEKLVMILNLKQEYEKENHKLHFLVALDETHLKRTFKSAGVSYVLSKTEIASKLTASYIFEPDVANFASDLLDSAVSGEDCDIQEYKIIENSKYLGKDYEYCFNDIKSKYNSILIGIARNEIVKEKKERKIYKLPFKENPIVKINDYFILIVKGEHQKDIQTDFKIEQGIMS